MTKGKSQYAKNHGVWKPPFKTMAVEKTKL